MLNTNLNPSYEQMLQKRVLSKSDENDLSILRFILHSVDKLSCSKEDKENLLVETKKLLLKTSIKHLD